MDTTKISGYMVEVEWDGQTLRARGTNKASHFALIGPADINIEDHVQEGQDGGESLRGLRDAVRATVATPEELVLDADEFTVEKFKPATMLVNGQLVLRTTAGRQHQLHFRKKHNADFTALARELGADV
ncbi:MAG TPA: hypothetical protein VK053_09335 [Jiangellaceae bacterium]|nr:hypothetical protein [Jiangellaceae bacterium]